MKSTLNTKAGREEFFLKMYRQSFPDVARYIAKRGGSLEDAKDVFQDSLVIYYEHLMDDKPIQDGTAYLFGVARHLWYKRFREMPSLARRPEQSDLLQVADTSREHVDEPKQLLAFLKSTGEKCLDLLKSFYYDRLSMEELAGKFGYRTTRSATVQKYKCLEKVRDQMKENSLTYADFTS